jgi:DNA-binding CsgD family transcriptional regulator
VALGLTANDSVRVRALTSVGTSLVMSGHTTEALELADGALPAALELRERFPRAPSWAFTTRWNALALSGQVDQALEEIDATIGLVDDPPAALRAQANSLRGRLHLAKGAAQTASRFLLDAAATAREVRVREPSWCIALAGEAEALLGHIERAEELSAEALSLRRDEILAYEVDERRALAWIEVQGGHVGAGIEHLWDASRLATNRGQRAFNLMILNDLLRLGERQAIALIEEMVCHADGSLAAAVGYHAGAASSEAPEDYEAAALSFEKIGFLLVAAELWSMASTRYREEGLRSRAKAAAKSSAHLTGLCEGARTQPLQWVGSGAATITRRQREIALLAAAGATNAQIATELTLSERTVESHLYAVFAKLDISDRAQLSSALEGLAP